MENLTPPAKIVLATGPILSAIFIALKLAGPLSSWSWWWAPVPVALVALLSLGFVMWINLAPDVP